MAEIVVLSMLVTWLACTLVMTVWAGRRNTSRARENQGETPARGTEPPHAVPGRDRGDPALASQP